MSRRPLRPLRTQPSEKRDLWRLYFTGEFRHGDPMPEDVEGTPGMLYFSADAEAAWEERRDAIMAEWIRERPGTRPRGWWKYDAPAHPDPHSREPERDFLARHGLLTPEELEI